jgi:hypothetical protein
MAKERIVESADQSREPIYELELSRAGYKIGFPARDVTVALRRCQLMVPYGTIACLYENGVLLGRLAYTGDSSVSVQSNSS